MDAKEFLSRAYLLELQVQTKLQQIEKLRAIASHVSGGIRRDIVKPDRATTGMEDMVLKIMEEEAELNRKIDELVDAKREIRRVTDQVNSVVLRLILEKRFLLFQDWMTIAIDMDRTPRWVLSKNREALEIVQKLLDEKESQEGGKETE